MKSSLSVFAILLTGSILNAMETNSVLLHQAVTDSNLELVKSLIQDNVNINAQNSDGRTPLHLAVDTRHTYVMNPIHLAIIDELLKVPHIQVNIQDREGNTPLHLAASGFRVIIRRLLVKGAVPFIRTNEHCYYSRMTAAEIANYKGDAICSQFIRSWGLRQNAQREVAAPVSVSPLDTAFCPICLMSQEELADDQREQTPCCNQLICRDDLAILRAMNQACPLCRNQL